MPNVTLKMLKILVFERVLGELWLLISLTASCHGPCQGRTHPRFDSVLIPQGVAVIPHWWAPDDPTPLVPALVYWLYWWVYPRPLLVRFFCLFVHTVTNIFAYIWHVCLIWKPVNPPLLSPTQLRVSESKFSTWDFIYVRAKVAEFGLIFPP